MLWFLANHAFNQISHQTSTRGTLREMRTILKAYIILHLLRDLYRSYNVDLWTWSFETKSCLLKLNLSLQQTPYNTLSLFRLRKNKPWKIRLQDWTHMPRRDEEVDLPPLLPLHTHARHTPQNLHAPPQPLIHLPPLLLPHPLPLLQSPSSRAGHVPTNPNKLAASPPSPPPPSSSHLFTAPPPPNPPLEPAQWE
jgi:hypothetical protein